MRMKRSFLYLFILMLLGSVGTALAQTGEIFGKVTDETNNPFPGVLVKVKQGGLVKSGAQTEDDGSYSVKPLTQGTYTIEFSAPTYVTQIIEDVVVSGTVGEKINIKMKIKPNELTTFEVVKRKIQLGATNGGMTSKQIVKTGETNITKLVTLKNNVQAVGKTGQIRIGGDRPDGVVFVIDGQVVQQGAGPVNPAQGTVDNFQVFSSGIPANLGDATGGVVSITTKGLSPALHGSIQGRHSIDGYNQNLINATLSGPLVSKKKEGDVKEPILGFLFGVDYTYNADASPTFYKNPVLKEDVLKRLQENPLTPTITSSGLVMLPSSNTVTKDDFVMQKRQLNNSSSGLTTNGKLDFALTDNINITAGGFYNYTNSDVYNRSNSFFAPESIPNRIGSTGRGFVRFKQSFTNNNTSSDTSKKAKAMISNAYYTVQVDYDVTNQKTEDPTFKRNLFDYGYVGKFTQNRVPLYQFGKDTASGRSAIILQSLDGLAGIDFQASDKNPILANYTKNVYANTNQLGFLSDLSQVVRNKGLMNGDFPNTAMSLNGQTIGNIGAGLTGYNYLNNTQIGLHADASFDFKPTNGKRAITHAIGFGLYYEQRSYSSYAAGINIGGAGDNSLWNKMRSLTNSHILAFDYSNPRFIHNGKEYTRAQIDSYSFFSPTDTIIYNRKYVVGGQSVFDMNLRSKLGLDSFDFIDMHSIDPSKLSLDMFSADELLNGGQSFVSYNGYDYTGKKLKGQVNFNDFFTDKNRPIAAFTPNYIAGYVMDKFRFEDMTFNVGVRIERYDNNTKVLKDPYSLYETKAISKIDGSSNTVLGKHPGNVTDDFVAYTDNNQSTTPRVVGYRKGDTWYNVYGVEISDPAVLKNDIWGTKGRDPQPILTPEGNIKIDNAKFDPNRSFTDYVPQVTASPRFQFDFPINDGKARFFAHYDVLVQRPKTGNYANAVDYMFLDRISSTIGNPNLKPQKTFDYELGYHTELTNNSGIGITAFYRERKDQIQLRPYIYATPITYYTYGNRDFSTTKGFNFTYDYVKVKGSKIPIDFSLAYTLQFADGTGSNATSGSGVLQNFITSGLPNLRYVAPMSYDSRHKINLIFDYGFDEGEGPTSKGGKHFLENFNANMIVRTQSGEPYTSNQNVIGNSIQGGLNGTRLPWHFGIDMNIQKRFTLGGFGKKSQSATDAPTAIRKKYYLSTFLYVQNIFNIKEVMSVYNYTNRPDDDGYLASPTGQQSVSSSLNPTAVQALYSLYVNNPGNYNFPRRANLGFTFSF